MERPKVQVKPVLALIALSFGLLFGGLVLDSLGKCSSQRCPGAGRGRSDKKEGDHPHAVGR